MSVTPGRIDQAAITTLLAERIDWRFKGMPESLSGLSIAAAREKQPNLFTDGFLPPLVALDDAAMTHNLTTFAAWCAERGLAHAPHGKTTMAPQLYARQFDHGAWGQTAANASQLRVYRAFGVSPVLLANELLDAAALRWLAGELAADPDFDFCCWVDSERGVALMTDALAGADRPVDVLVELGAPGGRTGVRDAATAVAIAEAVAASPVLRLAGVGGYEGAVAHGTDDDAMAAIRDYLTALRDLTLDLDRRGLFAGLDRVIVTAGGSAYFDVVADVLAAPWPAGLPVLPVVRSGAYLTHDAGLYRRASPLGEAPRLPVAPLRSALRAWGQVTSKPEADLALLTMGKRDVPYDIDPPTPEVVRRGGTTTPVSGTVTELNDQHTFLRDAAVEVGDWVGFGLSHPCTTFDKWTLLPVVTEDGTVVDLIRTFF
jgi:D-serine deaminase-like pyridoxal phosphate-dependent protein